MKLKLDELDQDFVHIYYVQTYHIGDGEKRSNVYAGSMHIEAIAAIFGKNVDEQVYKHGEIDIKINQLEINANFESIEETEDIEELESESVDTDLIRFLKTIRGE